MSVSWLTIFLLITTKCNLFYRPTFSRSLLPTARSLTLLVPPSFCYRPISSLQMWWVTYLLLFSRELADVSSGSPLFLALLVCGKAGQLAIPHQGGTLQHATFLHLNVCSLPECVTSCHQPSWKLAGTGSMSLLKLTWHPSSTHFPCWALDGNFSPLLRERAQIILPAVEALAIHLE